MRRKTVRFVYFYGGAVRFDRQLRVLISDFEPVSDFNVEIGEPEVAVYLVKAAAELFRMPLDSVRRFIGVIFSSILSQTFDITIPAVNTPPTIPVIIDTARKTAKTSAAIFISF